jgi:8-oxo-dGTP pyrophosphatase MutT (NUDIX family)
VAEDEPIRPAATVILWRDGPGGPAVLMGQRGAAAVFMPSKFVFPGGAVDPGDASVALAPGLPDPCRHRLGLEADGIAPDTLAAAAIRELWEEAGLALAFAAPWVPPPEAAADWQGFAGQGLAPSAAALRFVFRAVTPPGRSRRYDARFFLAPAAALASPSAPPSGELSGLHWVALAEARALDLPFVTEIVLAEVQALLGGAEDAGVPFFDNRGDRPRFRRLV